MNRFEVYRDKQGEWRWRLIAAENGRTIADSGEGYVDKAHAYRMMNRVTNDGFTVIEKDQ